MQTWGVFTVVATPLESSSGPQNDALTFFRSALLGDALYGDLWGLEEANREQRQETEGRRSQEDKGANRGGAEMEMN